jgi:diguanylate cyclase (GGDEF)-like protein
VAQSRSGARPAGLLYLLAAAAVLSLGATFATGYGTRSALLDAGGWVTHTIRVKLAIDECLFALGRDDAPALERAEEEVQLLTADNPAQQANIARAAALTGPVTPAARAGLLDTFAAMHREEDRLLARRVQRVDDLRATSTIVFVVGCVLTLAFGIAVVALLRVQGLRLERERALMAAILESVDEGVLAVDPSRRVLAINAATRALWGSAFPHGALPHDWRSVLRATYEDGTEMKPEDAPLARAIRGEVSQGVSYRLSAAEGSSLGAPTVWVSASARPIRDSRGRIVAAVTTLRNVTDQRAKTDLLRDQSMTDELTGLLNRRGFFSAASARFAQARAIREPVGILYADVNGLKAINDTLGHESGDRVIRDAAEVLRSVLRDSDLAARLGGDEFVAMLPGLAREAGDALMQRLAAAVRAHERPDRTYRLSVSADLTFVDWYGEASLEGLLAEADAKMYARKRARAGSSSPYVRAVKIEIRGDKV